MKKRSHLDSKAINPNLYLKSILDAKSIRLKNKQTYQTLVALNMKANLNSHVSNSYSYDVN